LSKPEVNLPKLPQSISYVKIQQEIYVFLLTIPSGFDHTLMQELSKEANYVSE
jgi:hypothetical protein